MQKTRPVQTIAGAGAAVWYARRDLSQASGNLWRARKWGYMDHEIRHFERLVCAALDHAWDCQQHLASLLPSDSHIG